MDEIKEEVKQPNMVESAKAQADRLEGLNKEIGEKLKRLEELKAFEALGGRTEGAKQVEAVKEITPQEYAKQVIEGKIKFK